MSALNYFSTLSKKKNLALPKPFHIKAVRSGVVLFIALGIPYLVPPLKRWRIVPLPGDPIQNETSVQASEVSPLQLTVGELPLRASENKAEVTNALPNATRDVTQTQALAQETNQIDVVDPTGHSLTAFHQALARTLMGEKKAITRISHYGDSIITSDLVSGTLRRRFHEHFGDAGHGFILTANPWPWYFHNDVKHCSSDGWIAHRIVGPLIEDGMYGLGGTSFHTQGYATSSFGTAERGQFGRRVSHFDIYYLEQPGGGEFEVSIVGSANAPQVVSTQGSKKISRIYPMPVPSEEGTITLKTRGKGDVRIFGVVLEYDQAGVSYDALGANGARARLLGQINVQHWKEQFALRQPSLIVLQYGANESEDPAPGPNYERSLGNVLDNIKTAAPSVSVLVVSAMDRADRSPTGKLRTRPIIYKLVEAQRRVALQHGCAFWNTFEAMGGEGTMGRWLNSNPALASGDLTHPTPAGAQIIGDLLFRALVRSYHAYASIHPEAPMPPEILKPQNPRASKNERP
ncbi:GDSL-type esterase/lipase family protein [Pajaroellobacter abortibovis]|uniref:SGNH hydrolase-type esterase domain-containing protein n=1 Tax=Pajaroellobacter abortibovis TaxID=1882918 RepID=A0A1L6MV28_9BACT|nr:GDSL-type esterase/lipase family protein [Pajaroellobacter abortibovis]APR99374.1 hypothetical protein BCY86_00775 [Pajaroellobacter abortibovis]